MDQLQHADGVGSRGAANQDKEWKQFDNAPRSKPSKSRRKIIAEACSADVETLINEYTEIPWYTISALRTHLDHLDGYAERTRCCIAIRLANELEDRLDLAMAFTKLIQTLGTATDLLGQEVRSKLVPIVANQVSISVEYRKKPVAQFGQPFRIVERRFTSESRENPRIHI